MTSGEISSTSARSTGWRKRAAERHAAAQPDDRDALRVRVQQQRQVREQALRQHVARVRRVDLAVDREHPRARRAADGHRRGGALLVGPRACRRRARIERRAPADTTRTCTRRSREAPGPSAARSTRWRCRPRRPRQARATRERAMRPVAATRTAASAATRDDPDDGRAQAEPRNERKTRGERAGNRAHGVRRMYRTARSCASASRVRAARRTAIGNSAPRTIVSGSSSDAASSP